MNITKCNCATLKGVQCTKNKIKGSNYCGIHTKKCSGDFGQKVPSRDDSIPNSNVIIRDLQDNIANLKEIANKCASKHEILLAEIEKCKIEKEKILKNMKNDDRIKIEPRRTGGELDVPRRYNRMGGELEKVPRHEWIRQNAEIVTAVKPSTATFKLLNDVLSIYKFPFILKNLDICKSVAKNENNAFTKMTNSMRIIYPNKFNINNVLQHNRYRHPIHINPKYENGVKVVNYDDINQDKMKQVLGYDKSAADNIDTKPELKGLRYSILGWTPVKGNITNEAYICHTWGVNMESRNTTDGRYVFGSTNTPDMDKYYELLSLVMCQIAAAADEVHKQTNKNVLMRISGLGLGAWSTAVDLHLPDIKKKYLEYLKIITATNRPWLTIMHPMFYIKTTVKIENGNINEALPSHPANTMADPFGPPNSVPINSVLLIINAWDDRSFIGNAGSIDNTLDGWITSGSGTFTKNYTKTDGMGSNFENSCYLHNSFFHPSLFADTQKHIGIQCV